MSYNVFPLTLEQRYADWFVMRRSRVTGTNAGLFLNHSEFYLTVLSLDASTATEQAVVEWLYKFSDVGLLQVASSTEAAMGGTSNEPAVLNFTRRIPAIEAVLKFIIPESFTNLHLASSSDGVAFLTVDRSIPTYLHYAGEIQCEENAL